MNKLLILKKYDALQSGIMEIVRVIKVTEDDVLFKIVWSSEEHDNKVISFVKETGDDPGNFWTYYDECSDRPRYSIRAIFGDWRNIE